MNAIFDTLNTVLDAVIDALAVALSATARAMLANVHAAEWASALLLAGRRGSSALKLLLFVLAVGAGAWLSWKTGHTGVTAQQAALAVMVLHGLKGRGWVIVKGGAK